MLAWEFQHPCFQRDEPGLLVQIKRKSSKATSTPPITSYPPRKPTLATAVAGGPGSSGSRAAAARERSTHVGSPSALDLRPRRESTSAADRGYPGSASRDRRPDTTGSIADRSEASAAPVRAGTSGGLSGGVWDSLRAGADARRSPPPPSSSHNQSNGSPHAPGFSHLPRPNTSEETPASLIRQIGALEAQVRSLTETVATQHAQAASRWQSTQGILQMLLSLVNSLDTAGIHREQAERCQASLLKLEPVPPPSAGAHLPPTPGSVGFGHYPPSSAWPSSSSGPGTSASLHHPLRSPRPTTSSSNQFFYQRPSLTAESYARGNRPDSRDESQFHSFGPSVSAPPYTGESSSGASAYGLPRPLSSSAGAYSYPSPRGSWPNAPPGSAPGERDPSRLGSSGPSWIGLQRSSENTLPPMISLLDGPGGEAVIPRRAHDDGPGAGDTKPGVSVDSDGDADSRKKIRR